MSPLSSSSPVPVRPTTVRVATALRRVWRQGYSLADLRADLGAGCVVGVVALPLSMALAIASGVAPQYGLFTAIVAGMVIAILGGSKVQVAGPTAAFVVILAPITTRFGLGGLLLATMMAGVILAAMGIARLGRFIEFVPYPVTTGFTAGIAMVIGTLQLKDFLGLDVKALPVQYVDRLAALIAAVPTARLADFLVGALTLVVLVVWPRLSRRVPAPLVALAGAGFAAHLATRLLPGFTVATIADRFSYLVDGKMMPGIPRSLPSLLLPWNLPGPGGAPLVFSFDLVRQLLPAAFTIAILGAIESLLSAVVADGMTGKKHDPDGELLAQGIGNFVAPFFGGFAATGAIARTATNVRAGARSPLAAVFHSLFVLAAMVAFAPLLGRLPMAALAALLLHVAVRMADGRHILHILKSAPRSDILVLVTCFSLTVLFDMVVAVTVGIVLASLLFMERMSAVSRVSLVNLEELHLDRPLPSNLLLYEIAGPLFFGAAQRAMNTVRAVARGVRVVVFDLRGVPLLDATGLVALESTVSKLREAGVFVVLAGVQTGPLRVLARAGWRNRESEIAIGTSFEKSLDLARSVAERESAGG
ncbi:MAG: C4-dicarboxylic acid transporter DauA [Thermoanaerobaculia bacterium]